MQPTDEELVLACRRGEESAWEHLILRYQRLLYSIPRRAGLDKDQADEVFQQVFTTLVERLNEIEQPARLQAWLVTIAKRETWRLIRREKPMQSLTRDEHSDGPEMKELADDTPLPDKLLARMEEQHLVQRALEELDERCRKLLKALFYRPDPAPYSEIAAELGTSEGSIGPTRTRCLKKLLRVFDEFVICVFFVQEGILYLWRD